MANEDAPAAPERDRLAEITLDEGSIARGNANIEHEREVAIYDLLDENSFALEGRDEGVVLVIEDDGVGFDVAAHERQQTGLGLVGMRERALLIGATLQVESKPHAGTTVFLRCPSAGTRQDAP